MRHITVIITFFISFSVFAQENMSFQQVDTLSYHYYMTGDWPKLIKIGKQGHKAGYDYYYLNYRLGVAYYYMANYALAGKHLNKAIRQNSAALQDSFLVRINYNVHLWTKNYYDAEQMRKFHPNKEIREQKVTKFLDMAYVEYGTSTIENIQNEIQSHSGIYVSSESDAPKYQNHVNFDLQGYITPRLKYQVAHTIFKLGRKVEIFGPPDSIYDYYAANQSTTYLALQYNHNHWYVNPALNLSGVQAEFKSFIQAQNPSLMDLVDTIRIDERNMVFALRTGYKGAKMSLGLLGSYSDFFGKTQYQFGLDWLYLPAGNLNRYLALQVISEWIDQNQKFIIRPRAGMKINSYLWTELDLKMGELSNSNIDNGYHIFNIQDPIEFMCDLKFFILINEHLEFDFVAQYSIRNNLLRGNPYLFISTPDRINIEYQQLNFIGGLKWKF